jgi:hypothetical protein
MAAQTLMIYQRGGTDFDVKLSTDLPEVNLRWVRGPGKDRYQATISLAKGKLKPGVLQGSLFIETNDPEFSSLTIPLRGTIR